MQTATDTLYIHTDSGEDPFDPVDSAAPGFLRWAAWKESASAKSAQDLIVSVDDPLALAPAQRDRIVRRLRSDNMVIVESERLLDKQALRVFSSGFGLARLDNNLCADGDGVTSLTVADGGHRGEYIPYSDRPLSWHTDGYYNSPERQIAAVILYCVEAAETGGENALLDHERLYIDLRRQRPDLLLALMESDAMVIPPNVSAGKTIRPERVGPVFSRMSNGALHMRYTARGRNIEWRGERALEAAGWIKAYLASSEAPVLRHTLSRGQILVTNNVLHNRTGFTDSANSQRLLYRARFFDRVAGTLPGDVLTELNRVEV
ncbi:MAG: TauD/TfdA family dioxygenase [Gammaproteobacteria bacterium]